LIYQHRSHFELGAVTASVMLTGRLVPLAMDVRFIRRAGIE
jgi:hypothetical protein